MFGLVAGRAQALQGTEHEPVPIGFVVLDVVGDRRRGDAASLEAGGAERLDLELVLRRRPPALKVVPGTPRQGLRRCEVSSVHRATIARPRPSMRAAAGRPGPDPRATGKETVPEPLRVAARPKVFRLLGEFHPTRND